MPGKVIPCALCQTEAAAVFCVNDDAHLCAGCDASVHASNPLLARHERRPLNSLACSAGECASAANNTCASPVASADCADVAVVPQFGGSSAAPTAQAASPAVEARAEVPAPVPAVAAPAFAAEQFEVPAMVPSAAQPAPLSLYEDAFFSRSLTTNDLLDLDGDELELPGFGGCSSSGTAGATGFAAGGFACFDPMDDCVVPSFGAPVPVDHRFVQQSSFMQQPGGYLASFQLKQQHQPSKLMVPVGGVAAAAKPAVQQQTDAEAEAARVQRHRERQRKKRAFGRTVRYQSRRAYAEIRPRIKGRFVTPEEYAVYEAQQAAAGLPVQTEAGEEQGFAGDGESCADASAPMAFPSLAEEDAVVPVPTFVA